MDAEIMNVRAKPLSLKDYLLDDLSSCSSNGFHSCPRRQCCTTVRYLLDIELKNQRQQQYTHFKKKPPDLRKSPSRSALSAFQYVITAVKRLPFAAGRLSEAEKPKKSMLARSISKKIIKNTATFWRWNPKEKGIQRLKSFDELLKEDPASDIVSATAQAACSSEFTEVVPVGKSDDVEVPLKDKQASNGGTMGATSSTDGTGITITNSKEKLWSNEEKEQLSPVSVLDCPFDDEDDEVSSPFQHGVAHSEGTNKKLMKKNQRFESLSDFEPLNLTERFASQPESDNDSPERPQQCPCKSKNNKFTSEVERNVDEDENDDIKALKLLHEFQQNHPSYGPKVKVDNLVLDFFRERITNEGRRLGESSFDEELLKEVEAWINGQNLYEPFLGWEVEANRQSYINDMEKDGTWKTIDQENMEVAFELETEILHTLLNEMCDNKATF
ncbi:hypothetical protein F511_04042 [Dorcoceras hygrometricum]|uniref:DUF4378 domain-containing protein n=1 Tax=Dorcoceras hygrometricum TaxID=472368 RepID=A0A2Z7CL41_9LAMI|nr:hypothetical protein F511_04042 [Dorcoceras hygrometricum]